MSRQAFATVFAFVHRWPAAKVPKLRQWFRHTLNPGTERNRWAKPGKPRVSRCASMSAEAKIKCLFFFLMYEDVKGKTSWYWFCMPRISVAFADSPEFKVQWVRRYHQPRHAVSTPLSQLQHTECFHSKLWPSNFWRFQSPRTPCPRSRYGDQLWS